MTERNVAQPGMSQPFAPGSVSLRLYPHADLDAAEMIDELCAQAALAADRGFDGVMTSEHHGGFPGYLPNPLQVAGFALDAMATGWAAACPLLLPLRPTPLVIEEVAWLAARFPGRVGVGVAAGGLPADFDVVGAEHDGLTARFAAALNVVADALAGRDAGGLRGDQAVQRCATHPVPVVSAAMGTTAVQRAARVGVGIVFDSLTAPARVRELTDAYRAAGGTGPCILIRRAWIGDPPRDMFERQIDVYRSYSAASAQAKWAGDQLAAGSVADIVEHLAGAAIAAGCDSLNLRVHVPGISRELAREQIGVMGDSVLADLKTRVA